MSRANGKKEVIEKIQKWIGEEGYESSVVQQAYADFQIDLRNPAGSIIVPKNKIDCVTFATYIQLGPDDKNAFSDLKDKEKKLEILSDLQRSLIAINVEYSFSPDFDSLEKVAITKNVYFDALTKDKLVDTIFALRRATAAVGLMCQQLQGRYYSNSNTRLTIYT